VLKRQVCKNFVITCIRIYTSLNLAVSVSTWGC